MSCLNFHIFLFDLSTWLILHHKLIIRREVLSSFLDVSIGSIRNRTMGETYLPLHLIAQEIIDWQVRRAWASSVFDWCLSAILFPMSTYHVNRDSCSSCETQHKPSPARFSIWWSILLWCLRLVAYASLGKWKSELKSQCTYEHLPFMSPWYWPTYLLSIVFHLLQVRM